jgi:integral membrane protein
MKRLLNRYMRFMPFSDKEAWLLFKLAAIGEACGWTLLISGILIQRFITPHSNIPVLLTGQIHGMLFLLYITAAIIVAPSLNWSLRRTIIAGLFAVPPYGSLMFELWAADIRKRDQLDILRSSIFYRQLLTV